MSLGVFTTVHVIISVVGIAAGLVVVGGMLSANRLPLTTAIFLATTVLTSATGFFFPFEKLLPSHIVGLISLIVLALALVGLYGYRLVGRWRAVYVVGAVIALYFNVFVAVAQTFAKVPALTALAPTQSEPAFAVTQLAVLVSFVVLGYLAVRGFRPGAVAPVPVGAR